MFIFCQRQGVVGYDFTLNGNRYTKIWFRTKRKAKQVEAEKRKEVLNPPPEIEEKITNPILTDMEFLELVNRRLDDIKEDNSEKHHVDHTYYAKRWCGYQGKMKCADITENMVQAYLLRQKRKISAITANTELGLLRSLFFSGLRPPEIGVKRIPQQALSFFQSKKPKICPAK